MRRILGVIPARAGSKGLPNKNMADLVGLPLVAHAVKCAQLCPSLTETVVSTNSNEIADAALEAGGLVYDLRPGHLSGDETSIIDVLDYEIHQANLRGDEYDAVCLLSPTTPLRWPQEVEDAIAASAHYDTVAAMTRCEWVPQWALSGRSDNYMGLVEQSPFERRQDWNILYRFTGSVYVWNELTDDWLYHDIHPVLVDNLRAVDIDTEDDLTRARALVEAGYVKLPWL